MAKGKYGDQKLRKLLMSKQCWRDTLRAKLACLLKLEYHDSDGLKNCFSQEAKLGRQAMKLT